MSNKFILFLVLNYLSLAFVEGRNTVTETDNTFNSSFSDTCSALSFIFTNQSQIDAFPSLNPGCSILNGNLGITGFDITNLDSLSQIKEVLGSVQVTEVSNISFDGLNNIKNILGSLRFNDMYSTLGLGKFDSLLSVGGSIEINNVLASKFETINNLEVIGGDLIFINRQADTVIIFNKLRNIQGRFRFQYFPDVKHFKSFDQLESVGDNVEINSPGRALISLDCIKSISNVNGSIQFSGSISDYGGFENLTTIHDFLLIENNNIIQNIIGFNHLNSIQNALILSNNKLLVEITGFQNLLSVGSLQIYNNGFLSSIVGLDHPMVINQNYGNSIYQNPFLSTCNVESICNKLFQSVGEFDVYNNGINCQSVQQILSQCGTFYDQDGDGVQDSSDNCPTIPNPQQTDLNFNGIGDACEEFQKVGINIDTPKKELHISNGDIFIDNPEKGIIFKDYNGNCWRTKVTSGQFNIIQVDCP